MTPTGPRNSRLVLLALAAGTFFTAEEVFMDLAGGRGSSASQDVVNGLEFWLVWAALTPAIGAAIRRWPLSAPTVARSAAHAATAVGLSIVHWMIMRGASPVAFVWGMFTGVIFYAGVVTFYTALAFRSELAQAKLDTLRSQLRPHFLFNTLNAISVFVGEDAAKARQLILHLAALLRRSLDQQGDEVSLAEELTFANDYLDIQRGRFGARLAVVVDVSPDALRGIVPVFLLQPLLENAIEHGMPDDGRITVTIRGARSDGALCLSVIDDGAGFAEEPAQRNGIGIANTRARLAQLYGTRARVDWRGGNDRSVSSGTVVEIRVPYRETRV